MKLDGRRISSFVLTVSLIFSLGTAFAEQDPKFAPSAGAYLGQAPPGLSPQIFAPGLVSAEAPEFHPAFSSDGKRIYFSRMDATFTSSILMMEETGDGWTSPITAHFSGEFNDAAPFFSPDGSDLYFMSMRPRSGEGEQGHDANLWKLPAEEIDSAQPIYVGSPTAHTQGWWTARLHSDGYFYFGCGALAKDLLRTRLTDGAFEAPESLGPVINDPEAVDVEPALAPDGSFIVFYSAGRPDQMGEGLIGDLYVSFRGPDDSWGPAINLGPEINSSAEENWPVVSPDGKYLFFSSGRDNPNGFPDIFWVDVEAVTRLRNFR
jgi:Tol biopolymer transport system component